MAQNVDIVYKNILVNHDLKRMVAENRLFSSLIQRAPYDIVSVVAIHQNRPIAFIFGTIEEKIKNKICRYNVVREKKEQKNYISNILW